MYLDSLAGIRLKGSTLKSIFSAILATLAPTFKAVIRMSKFGEFKALNERSDFSELANNDELNSVVCERGQEGLEEVKAVAWSHAYLISAQVPVKIYGQNLARHAFTGIIPIYGTGLIAPYVQDSQTITFSSFSLSGATDCRCTSGGILGVILNVLWTLIWLNDPNELAFGKYP
ncbi:hypothetical protein B0H13DRAFT_1869702 [Mycena leptocephala]|nr:hypothetical protein B0H13DRAFT_1869702 [Mycena leptocephala]